MNIQNIRYWKIAIPKPIDTLFTYSNATDADITGFRVLVPFGKKEQLLQGIVVQEELKNELQLQKVKPIAEILDTLPCFSHNMLKFITWMASYYHSPIGEAVKITIPAGISPKSLIKIYPNRDKSESELQDIYQQNPVRWRLLSFLLSTTQAYSIDYLEQYLNIKNIQYHINFLLERNLIFIEQTNTRISEKFVKAIKLNEQLLTDSNFRKETLDTLDKKAKKQSDIIAFAYLKQHKNTSPQYVLVSDINKIISGANTAIQALKKKNLIEFVDVEVDRNKASLNNQQSLATKNEAILKLTEEQQICIDAINKKITSNIFAPFLLYGVTGSGKTLVYIHIIKKALSEDKTVLLLLPEISLTPQLIDRFSIVFPEHLSVLHSRLTDGERYDAWRAALSGKAKIVIGARSALFAPLQNLGLIIVDEEHEHSYKQDSTIPYYQARDAAIMRAKIENTAIVLGSATPSIESYFNAQRGKYELLTIKQRADNAQLPQIKMIDMLDAKRTGQVIGSFSRTMIDTIKEKIYNKEGIILFQNKRGFASHLECNDCGYIPQCKHCSVSLTYHQVGYELRCHYCGYTRKSFKTCEMCGAPQMHLVGSGTQRVEEELLDILKMENTICNIERFDLDSVTKKGAHRNILQRFNNGETDILIGTQMVAKGLDFERVTLVGVVNADIQLMLPDFRAAERTFQLLSQVAGRAGRSSQKKGEVIIQTNKYNEYAISLAKDNDFEKFYQAEITQRLSAQFPPFTNFCVIEFSGKDERLVNQKANEFYTLFKNSIAIINSKYSNAIIFYTPQMPPISKLNDNYRMQFSVKSIKNIDPQKKCLNTLLKNTIKEYLQKYSSPAVKIKIDIDAYNCY